MFYETNRETAFRFFDDVWNQQSFDLLDDLCHEEAVFHLGDDLISDLAIVKQMIAGWFEAFPDSVHTVEDIIAENDKVVVRFSGYGTHLGEFMEIPATEREFRYTGINIFRFYDGRIAEVWANTDMLGLVQQLTE